MNAYNLYTEPYNILRGRRNTMWYRKALEERALEKGHAKLAERIGPAFARHRRTLSKEV